MPGSIVWLASYVKSGNTWLRLLLANLLSGSQDPVDINQIDNADYSITDRRDIEALTLTDSSLLSHTELDLLWPYMVTAIAGQAKGDVYHKLHEAYRRDAEGEPLLGRGHARAALYVLRDPRDVAVSLAHHSGISLDRAIAEMNRMDCTPAAKLRRHTPQIRQVQLDWSSHVESWADQRDVPVHIIRYEDMLTDNAACLRGIVAFLGLDVVPHRVEHAVRCTEFKALQAQEKERGFRERPPVAGQAAPFFRSGRAGAWREVLSPEQEQAIIAAHGRVMRRFGYL